MQVDRQAKCDTCKRILPDDLVSETKEGKKICAECQYEQNK